MKVDEVGGGRTGLEKISSVAGVLWRNSLCGPKTLRSERKMRYSQTALVRDRTVTSSSAGNRNVG